jgi:hypothetical protein
MDHQVCFFSKMKTKRRRKGKCRKNKKQKKKVTLCGKIVVVAVPSLVLQLQVCVAPHTV